MRFKRVSLILSIFLIITFLPLNILAESDNESGEPKLVFEVISDTHIKGTDESEDNSKYLINSLNSIKNNFPETSLVVNCGDFTDYGKEIEMKGYFDILGKYDEYFDFITAMGNHDAREHGWASCLERYLRNNNKYMGETDGKAYHDRWINGYHFIVMNTEYLLDMEAYISDEQLSWLDETMAENADPNKPIFLITHQPLKDTFTKYGEWPIGVQDHKVKEILRKYPQTILFSGHRHDGTDSNKLLKTDFGTMVNVPAIVNSTQNPKTPKQNQMGFHVSVFDDRVEMNLFDYSNNSEITGHSYIVKTSKDGDGEETPVKPKPVGKFVDVNFDDGKATNLSSDEYAAYLFGEPSFVYGVNGGQALNINNIQSNEKQYLEFDNFDNILNDDFTIMFNVKGNLNGKKEETLMSFSTTLEIDQEVDDPEEDENLEENEDLDEGPELDEDLGEVENSEEEIEENIELLIGNFGDAGEGISLGIRDKKDRLIKTENISLKDTEQWHAITLVGKNSKLALYMNGEEVVSLNIDLEDYVLDGEIINKLIFGANKNHEELAEFIYIDELKVFKKALSSSEIRNHWGPFRINPSINHINISWDKKNLISTNTEPWELEPSHLIINNNRIIDIGSKDTSVIITRLRSNRKHNIKFVTKREAPNKIWFVDVYEFNIETRSGSHNKDLLIGLYELHEKKSEFDYELENWTEFYDARSDAEKVLDNINATKSQVDKATNDLALAADLLQPISGTWIKDNKGWRYKKDGDYVKNKWEKIRGDYYYFNSDSYMVANKWEKINNYWYHFDKYGVMETGFIIVDDKVYYLNESKGSGPEGSMRIGWINIDDKSYYANSDGAIQTGWVFVDDKWYYINPGGKLNKGWTEIKNEKYYMNSKGAMKTGWLYYEDNWYYLSSSGAMQIGWQKVNNEWYYMDAHGIMQTGWISYDDNWRFMSDSGSMQIGWQKINNKWYYLSSSGIMQIGWHFIDDNWYCMDLNGVMFTGSQKISDKTYEFSNSGAWQGNWERTGSKYWFRYSKGGFPKNKWEKIADKWYHFDEIGYMDTGWKKISNKWYYLNSSGVMQTGWVKISNKWYYLNSSGAMQTGWVKISNKWYYLNSSGVMQTGWKEIDAKWYYFYSDGSMAYNTVIDIYRIGNDGSMM